jgi:hypothetical protein
MPTAILGLLLTLGLAAQAEETPTPPYVDPAQLDVPWPKHSFLKIPWRGFLETRSGHQFLQGIGVNYNVPGQSELAVRLLAEAGFKTFRIEVGWGSVRWEEDGLSDGARIRWLLDQCRRNGIRPTLLLNAHHGVPCPSRSFDLRLEDDAVREARRVKFVSTEGIVAGKTGLSNLTDYWGAEVLITRVDAGTRECELSKPLPKSLKHGQDVRLTTLKYLPLHPVGTAEFDETAAGWVRYALLVCEEARKSGIDGFDVEIWNELTFGTHFLDIDNYREPKSGKPRRDALHEGGTCWELARRTADAVKRRHAQARCIWGFSNTTFFHTRVEELPAGIDGQSYHPYGTGTRTFPKDEDYLDRPAMNLDGRTPSAEVRIPEGLAHTFIKTESLMRLLNPEAKGHHPPGVARFYHYMTEHGVAPPECGARDEAAVWRLKTLCALRSFCLWLNKGVDALHYFCAFEEKVSGMGLLAPDLSRLRPDARFDDVATPPLKALRNLTRTFAGSAPLRTVQPLQVDVTPLDAPRPVFNKSVPLSHSDVFAFLPFQLDATRHVVAVFVSTYDATVPMPEERFRLKIRGLVRPGKTARLYDPVTDHSMTIALEGSAPTGAEVEVPVVDYPRLLILGESK